MTQQPFLIKLDNLGVRFADRWALYNLSLQIDKGEIVTLIGPNGAGKTTLVRVLLGLIAPTTGDIQSKAKLRIGYMPQKISLEPTMPLTVERFLRMAARTSVDEREHALSRVGAVKLSERMMVHLSGGEMQRVLLARALLRKPELLVLDEPAQGIDASGQVELYDLIAEIRDELNCGVLLVSHDLHLVMAKTCRVICLNRHICCHGSPDAVSQDPAFQALFAPQELQSLALYTHHHDHQHDVSGEVDD